MGELEHLAIQSVGFKYRGAGRMVLSRAGAAVVVHHHEHADPYPRLHRTDLCRGARTASEGDKHNKFYDEYLAVMDMTAEFYLSTVERIFKNLEIAQNRFTVDGRPVDIGKITDVAVMTVEGRMTTSRRRANASRRWTCAPACRRQEGQHLEPGAGHYGIFAGKSWRLNIRPLVLDFIDENAALAGQRQAASQASGRRRGRRLRRQRSGPFGQRRGLTSVPRDGGTRSRGSLFIPRSPPDAARKDRRMTDHNHQFWSRLDDINSGMLGVTQDSRLVPMSHYTDRKVGVLWFITAKDTDWPAAWHRVRRMRCMWSAMAARAFTPASTAPCSCPTTAPSWTSFGTQSPPAGSRMASRTPTSSCCVWT